MKHINIVCHNKICELLSIVLDKTIKLVAMATRKDHRQQCKFLNGAQSLSRRVIDSGPRGHGFEPHRRHCVVVLEQDTFILA